MSREEKVKKILEKTNAVLSGHFVYVSAKHGERYINKRCDLSPYERNKELCSMWAKDFADSGWK